MLPGNTSSRHAKGVMDDTNQYPIRTLLFAKSIAWRAPFGIHCLQNNKVIMRFPIENPCLRSHGRASKTRLNGVCAARRNRVKPAAVTVLRMRSSPACAPSAAPTSWARDAGVQIMVEAE